MKAEKFTSIRRREALLPQVEYTSPIVNILAIFSLRAKLLFIKEMGTKLVPNCFQRKLKVELKNDEKKGKEMNKIKKSSKDHCYTGQRSRTKSSYMRKEKQHP